MKITRATPAPWAPSILSASHKEALNWIARNDRDAVTAFIEEYVRRNFKTLTIEGVKVTTEKEAF